MLLFFQTRFHYHSYNIQSTRSFGLFNEETIDPIFIQFLVQGSSIVWDKYCQNLSIGFPNFYELNVYYILQNNEDLFPGRLKLTITYHSIILPQRS